MEIIISHSPFVKKLIGVQRYNCDKKYRILKFCIIKKLFDVVLIFNSMTKELICLDQREFDDLTKENLDSNIYKELVNRWFLIPEETDDVKLNEQIENCSLPFDYRFQENHYIIATTLDCNARCFYCFEYGSNRESMSTQTAHKTAEYIYKTCRNKPVFIQWFGGEPLYNCNVIDVISDDLRNQNVEFKAIMISNGYLFDREIVKRAKKNWNLKLVQITLDGTEKVYNKIKSYINNDSNPFEKVLNNINLLIQSKIHVRIRMNLGRHNVNDLYKLVDIIYDRFGISEYLKVYAWALFDGCGAGKRVKSTEERQYLTNELLKLENYINNKGYKKNLYLNRQIKCYRCMADNDRSIMILPNGNLSKCERCTNETKLGNIENYSFDIPEFAEWKERCAPMKSCKTCPLLPECRRLKKCPDEKYFQCDDFEYKKKINSIMAAMQSEYERYCEKKNS